MLFTPWVGLNEDIPDVAARGTYTYHRGLNAECSLIHSADCTTLPASPVTAQFICPVLPYPSSPCLSILRSARGWPPSLSISLAAHKTVIQTLLVVCGGAGASAARCNCGRIVAVRYKECGWLLWSCTAVVLLLYCWLMYMGLKLHYSMVLSNNTHNYLTN